MIVIAELSQDLTALDETFDFWVKIFGFIAELSQDLTELDETFDFWVKIFVFLSELNPPCLLWSLFRFWGSFSSPVILTQNAAK